MIKRTEMQFLSMQENLIIVPHGRTVESGKHADLINKAPVQSKINSKPQSPAFVSRLETSLDLSFPFASW
jgi:hypothetical protein